MSYSGSDGVGRQEELERGSPDDKRSGCQTTGPSGTEAATNRHLDVRFEPALQKTAGLENVGRGQPVNSTAIHIAFACSELGLLAKLSSFRGEHGV